MSKKYDGGPAFTQTGISERDYFATRAMEAFLIANPNANTNAIAEWSYAMADAMLLEKDK